MNAPVKEEHLWSVILAGGEGERMRSLLVRWLGRHKPKQYCTFVGTRSMFQHTLDRADMLSAPERRVTLIARAHRREAERQMRERPSGQLILQPANRDTAAGVLLALAHVRVRDPQATVVIYPADHFVFPEQRFVEAVRGAVRAAEDMGDRVVLLGAQPDRADVELGWIRAGGMLRDTGNDCVRAILSFTERPSRAETEAAMASGGLWNTLVMTAMVETLWNLGWKCLPEMMPLFERLCGAINTPNEEAIMNSLYKQMPERNFSSHVLARAPERLAVIELSEVIWNDWGKPVRIVDSLRRIGRQPAFPLESLEACTSAQLAVDTPSKV